MGNGKAYDKTEFIRLHEVLYDILSEITRVCRKFNINYFLIGGSAIGAYFWQGIIPFDDDIDIGMTRDNYERFLKLAPQELRGDYLLQCYATEPHMPYYFAKVRKRHTLYVETVTKDVPMHQGIFVDVIPFDSIPESSKAERLQWKTANFIYEIILSKELESENFIHPLTDRILCAILPKSVLVWMLKCVQTWYNNRGKVWYNNVMIHNDHIPTADLDNLQTVQFGKLKVFVPDNLEQYLHRHYPTLKKHLSNEEIEQYAHAPLKLSLG